MLSTVGKRLRHPVHAIREPFGKAGLIVAVCALVLALSGAAFAAGALTSKQKKEVTKIAKKYAKSGPTGPQGAPGPVGAVGPKGEKGDPGADGAQGEAGPQGLQGVQGATGPAGAQGATGPAGAQGATGATGPEGPEGSPWTAGGTLPSGETETGMWSVGGVNYPEGAVLGSVSFAIPLAEPIPNENRHFLAVGEGETTECPGNVNEPAAAPGHLCVYSQISNNVSAASVGAFGYTSGALLFLVMEAGGSAAGSYAVTAP